MSRAHRPGRTFYSTPACYEDGTPIRHNEVWLSLSARRLWIDLLAQPGELYLIPWNYQQRFEDAGRNLIEYAERMTRIHFDRLIPEAFYPPISVAGDPMSLVPPDTVKTLVDLAREGREDDFRFLAGASGVARERQDELWTGTRQRLGLGVAP